MKISTLPLLLVVLGFDRHAQARILPVRPDGNGAPKNFKDHSDGVKDIVPRTKSIVQDWNLVCEQLCGAGLGGPSCGPQCTTESNLPIFQRTKLVSILLGENEREICIDLCKLNIGKPTCPCKETLYYQKNELNRNIICQSFCKHNNITLSGCSPCLHLENVSSSTTVQEFIGTKDAISQKTAAASPSVTSETINEAAKSFEPIDEATQTSTQGPTPTTTPNWNEVCLSLCKIGEGGALCNCDLPPFF